MFVELESELFADTQLFSLTLPPNWILIQQSEILQN